MKLKSLICLLVAFTVTSQLHAGNPGDVSWGVKATVDAELPTKWHGKNNDWKMFHNGVGFTLGALSHIPLGRNFYVEPEVEFFMSQYRYDLVIMEDDRDNKNPKLSKFGIGIPVVAGYNINFSQRFGMRIFTGPQIRYAFAGKVGVARQLKDEYEKLLLWDTNRRFDFSWKVGIGFAIDNFMISAEADFGISNLYRRSPVTDYSQWRYHENRVGGGVTYYF